MADLVIQGQLGQDVTTSLIVARVFGKEHNKVVRDVETLSCSDSFRVANFGEATFSNPKTGQQHKMVEMTKDGFSFLVMGYTGTKAGQFKEAFINEFNRREAELRKRSQADLSRYVPIERFENLKRVAHMEKEMAHFWQESAQRYLALYQKTVENPCKMIDERLAAVHARAARSTPAAPTWMTVAGYASLNDIPVSLSMAGGLGRKAKILCNQKGITPDTIPDPRFGRVNTYPVEILKEVFDAKIK